MAHQTVVVDPATRVVFGLIGQILHVRVTPPKKETAAQKRGRESLESRLWVRGLDASGPRPDGAAWVDVADRGAAVFEFLSELVASDIPQFEVGKQLVRHPIQLQRDAHDSFLDLKMSNTSAPFRKRCHELSAMSSGSPTSVAARSRRSPAMSHPSSRASTG